MRVVVMTYQPVLLKQQVMMVLPGNSQCCEVSISVSNKNCDGVVPLSQSPMRETEDIRYASDIKASLE